MSDSASLRDWSNEQRRKALRGLLNDIADTFDLQFDVSGQWRASALALINNVGGPEYRREFREILDRNFFGEQEMARLRSIVRELLLSLPAGDSNTVIIRPDLGPGETAHEPRREKPTTIWKAKVLRAIGRLSKFRIGPDGRCSDEDVAKEAGLDLEDPRFPVAIELLERGGLVNVRRLPTGGTISRGLSLTAEGFEALDEANEIPVGRVTPVPAADRYVTLDDNRPEVAAMRSEFEELFRQIHGLNHESDRDVAAAAELEYAKLLIEKPQVSVELMSGILARASAWVAVKAGSWAAGEAIKATLATIWKLFKSISGL